MSKKVALLGTLMATVSIAAGAQDGPVPLINQPLAPAGTVPGGPQFTLTVNGTGFVPDSTVNWNRNPLQTTFVSGSQLTATVLAIKIAVAGTASVTVNNLGVGATSNAVFFEVVPPESAVEFSQASFATGLQPLQVTTGDFNGDGKLDLAVFNQNCTNTCNPATVSILLGNGSGTFQPHVDYSESTAGSGFLAGGDFNGDGQLDLAVSNDSANAISVFLGRGDGTFQSPIVSPAGFEPAGLTVGDFNGDGKLDLVVENINSSTGAVLLGRGDGTFQSPISYSQPSTPGFPITGDFNGDGKLDLVIPAQNYGDVYVMLGNGDGTFQTAVAYPTASGGAFVTTADFNGDGKLDLAVSANNAYAVSVLLGNGDGTFRPYVDYSSGGQPALITTGDFNGDGILDLATLNTGSSAGGSFSLLLGNGDGSFRQSADYSAPSESQWLVPGDFNQDGKLDIAIADAGSNTVDVLTQAPEPTVVLSAGSLSFGKQIVGTTSPAQSVTLSNTGNATLTIISITVTGADLGDFAQTNTCGSSVPAGGNCVISVTFAPMATGSRFASLSIADNALGNPQTVSLKGGGILPVVSLSATNLTFVTQLVGTVSASQYVYLNNVGTAPLTFSGFTVSGDFEQSNNCHSPLNVGMDCTISVSFSPLTKGTLTGTITIIDNAMPVQQTITLTGTATVVDLSASIVNFGSQPVGSTAGPNSITLTNTADTTLVMHSIGISGANPGDFAQTNTCGSSMQAKSSCTITITFTPKSKGTRSATLDFNDNGGGSPQTVGLTGIGD
jgi:hypothetical protein